MSTTERMCALNVMLAAKEYLRCLHILCSSSREDLGREAERHGSSAEKRNLGVAGAKDLSVRLLVGPCASAGERTLPSGDR